MAKAQFHKHQKVWVEAVGAWASVEKLVPIWAKGFDEPVRITYDVGLGREFLAHELRAEATEEAPADDQTGGEWRLMRARNKWQAPEACTHHPYPGTFPVVVTNKTDWGGWRVPGAEYDRDPFKIEFQARLLAAAPKLMRIARELNDFVSETGGEAPEEVLRLGRAASAVLRALAETPQAPDPEQGRDEEAA